jgi:RNA ligase, DRB0094 family
MERKLVTVRLVKAITPIKDADRIELIHIDGWKVVAQKGLYKVGDYVVYFEVDSFLPILPQFEWLRPSSYRKNEAMGEGFRIKTVKLRGQISQGILMPLSEIAAMLSWPSTEPADIDIDTIDLAEKLGVKKWDPFINAPITKQNVAKGNFPGIIRKTDQERWQNLTNDIEALIPHMKYEVTEKLDGSSITIYYCNYTHPGLPERCVGVCSRNLDLKPEGKFWDAANDLGIIGKLIKLGKNVALQGELIGPGIQGNKYKLDKHDIYFYDVWDIDQQTHLDPRARDLFLTALDVKQVPKFTTMQPNSLDLFEDLWKSKSVYSKLNKDTIIEGVVFKAETGSFSFKVINPEFLLKEND